MQYNYLFLFIFYITVFSHYINCQNITTNQLNLAINSYQNNVLKNFEEVLEIRNNGTVSKYNILFNLKKYAMNMDKKKIERNIEKLQESKKNLPYKINEAKLLEEINLKEKSFLRKYKQILNIARDTNKLYLRVIQMIKTAFIIFICFIIITSILTIEIMIYITSPRYKKYNMLIDEKDKDKDNSNNPNSNDSEAYKVVKILNNFISPNKEKNK